MMISARKPGFLKSRLPVSGNYSRIRQLLSRSGMHTVCEEASCPNIGECWDDGTATFLIMGDTCTRKCGYCKIKTGIPSPLYKNEPESLALIIKELGLQYAVITSVTRDDLPDGGASVFSDCVKSIRKECSGCRIELLIPDLKGDAEAISAISRSAPDVIGHNMEVPEPLFRRMRPQGSYRLSLSLLKKLKELNPGQAVKSGFMVGLGENEECIFRTIDDIRSSGADILTIGQYLQPSRENAPVAMYYSPDDFARFREYAKSTGFKHAECGPLVRSSYRAQRQAGR